MKDGAKQRDLKLWRELLKYGLTNVRKKNHIQIRESRELENFAETLQTYREGRGVIDKFRNF